MDLGTTGRGLDMVVMGLGVPVRPGCSRGSRLMIRLILLARELATRNQECNVLSANQVPVTGNLNARIR
jgi:hypothetical protein